MVINQWIVHLFEYCLRTIEGSKYGANTYWTMLGCAGTRPVLGVQDEWGLFYMEPLWDVSFLSVAVRNYSDSRSMLTQLSTDPMTRFQLQHL